MTWLDRAAAQFASNHERLNTCEIHDSHETVRVRVILDGPSAIPDYPPILSTFAIEFDILVFDYGRYEDVVGYCTGKDAVSRSVLDQNTWEGFETLLALDILSKGDPSGEVVVDLGAHVGWYTLLAKTGGYGVLSVDGDQENLELLQKSVTLNGLSEATVAHGWIGPETPIIKADGPGIRLLKADVEGAEDEVLRVCDHLFAAGKVKYAFFEISPEFSDHYPATVQKVLDFGYAAYMIPDKGTPIEAFSADPLGYTLNRPRLFRSDIEALKSQVNIVFVLEDS